MNASRTVYVVDGRRTPILKLTAVLPSGPADGEDTPRPDSDLSRRAVPQESSE